MVLNPDRKLMAVIGCLPPVIVLSFALPVSGFYSRALTL